MTTKSVLLKDLFKFEAKQFCLNTALHGYRFIVLPKRIVLERVFWIIIVTISFVTATALMCIAWTTFQKNPTVLVIDSTHYPIWNYPFPAVTICSFNKISKARAYKLATQLKRPYNTPVEDIVAEMRILFQLIFNNNQNISYKSYAKLQDFFEINDYTVEQVMMILAPTCKELLQRCKWKGEEERCETLFKTIKTSEGYCCSFNYFALKNDTFHELPQNKIQPKLPRRVSACGYQTALEILVSNNPDDYLATQIPAIGHRVLIHDSYVYPDWSAQNILVEHGSNTLIGITPSITYSTRNIKNIEIAKRKCIFRTESQLHNFGNYTYHNCLVECRMNLSRKLCGCIPFYYYHKFGTYPKTNICNLRDIHCLTEYQQALLRSVPGFHSNQMNNHVWGSEDNDCNCLPDCNYVDYVAESSTGIFTRKYSTNQQNLFSGMEIKHQSVVRVFFNDLVATKYRRDVVFSWHTLLAYYGGILGLFTGFSFLTVIELIYYFIVQLIIDYKHQKKVFGRKNNRNKLFNVKQAEDPKFHDQILNARHFLGPNKFSHRQRNY